jgi:hypothetical protein
MLIASAVPSNNVLAPFDNFVGHCWAADLGGGAVDRHCFEPVYDGAHVRDRHVVTQAGQIVYAGETIYSGEAGQISLIYLNSLGGVGHGSAALEGQDLVFRLRMRATPDGAPQDFVTTWRQTADGFDATTGDVVRHFARADQ